MCIYGSASFLSSCLSSNMQQWTISPQLKRESNSKKGARYNPLSFVAFRKHHRSHRVILIHHCDNSTVTISVTPLCISLFFTWLKGGNVSASLRSWEGLCFLSLPFPVTEVREYMSWFPPPPPPPPQRKAAFILYSNTYWSRYFSSPWNIPQNALT